MKRSLAFIAVVLLLSSCATIERSRDEAGMNTVAGLIESSQSETLKRLSSVPFLLDQEILVLPTDVASFWTGIIAARYSMEGPELEAAIDGGTAVVWGPKAVRFVMLQYGND